MTLPEPASVPVNGGIADAGVVVQVEDKLTAALAGHDGCNYESPPLPRADALALVRVLIGGVGIDAEMERWTCPIAGGQRTITIKPLPEARDRRPHEPRPLLIADASVRPCPQETAAHFRERHK